jgi:hypothetical protein
MLNSCWQRYSEFSLENRFKFQQRRSDDTFLLARQGLLMVTEEEWWRRSWSSDRFHRMLEVIEFTLGFSSSFISITWMKFPLKSDVQNNHCNLWISLNIHILLIWQNCFFLMFPSMGTSVIHKLHDIITFLDYRKEWRKYPI